MSEHLIKMIDKGFLLDAFDIISNRVGFFDPFLDVDIDDFLVSIPISKTLEIPESFFVEKKPIDENETVQADNYFSIEIPGFIKSSNFFNRLLSLNNEQDPMNMSKYTGNFQILKYDPKYIGIKGNLNSVIEKSFDIDEDPFTREEKCKNLIGFYLYVILNYMNKLQINDEQI